MLSYHPYCFPPLGPGGHLTIKTPEHAGALVEAPASAAEFSRHNSGKRHEEGIGQITPDLKELARRTNAPDEELHEFVTAKFCDRLRGLGLLEHPLVKEDLEGNERLGQRCEVRRRLC